MANLEDLPGEYSVIRNEAFSLRGPALNVLLVISALSHDGKHPVHIARVRVFSAAAGIPERTVRRAVDSLIREGWIDRVRKHLYLAKAATSGRNGAYEAATSGRKSGHQWPEKRPPVAGKASREPYRADKQIADKNGAHTREVKCKCGAASDAYFIANYGCCRTCYSVLEQKRRSHA